MKQVASFPAEQREFFGFAALSFFINATDKELAADEALVAFTRDRRGRQVRAMLKRPAVPLLPSQGAPVAMEGSRLPLTELRALLERLDGCYALASAMDAASGLRVVGVLVLDRFAAVVAVRIADRQTVVLTAKTVVAS